jgi:hypothetical protein
MVAHPDAINANAPKKPRFSRPNVPRMIPTLRFGVSFLRSKLSNKVAARNWPSCWGLAVRPPGELPAGATTLGRLGVVFSETRASLAKCDNEGTGSPMKIGYWYSLSANPGTFFTVQMFHQIVV